MNDFHNRFSFLNHPRNFWYFILGLTIIRLIYINFIPISPQEAYYWYYSQKPALSYFDHPPMAAYSIWLGTHIFGNTIFGVKFMGIIWSLLTNILLYFITIKSLKYFSINADSRNQNRMAFLVVVLFNLTIFAHLYSLIVVPDTPLLFFWLLVIYLFQEALETNKIIWWIWMGAALGLGLTSKYTAIAVLPALLTILIIEKKYRNFILKPGPYISLVFTLLVFLPVIYWNSEHHWASFLFQFNNRAGAAKSFRLNYIGQLIASQLFLLSPLIFILIIRALGNLMKNWRINRLARFFFITGIFLIGGFIFVSFTSHVKMNWLLPGYLGWIIVMVLLLKDKILKDTKWTKAGIFSSLILIILAHAVWLVPNVPLGDGNTWSGWPQAAPQIYRLQQEMGGKKKCFIFANSYKSASLLKFYLPDQQDVYTQNIYGRPALQFDFWPLPDSLNGEDALYVISDRKEYKNDLKKVEKYFEEVSLLHTFEYKFFNTYKTRTIYCYLARNYKKHDLKKVTASVY